MQGVPEIGVGLEEFVTKRTLKMFSVVDEQMKGKEKSSFLNEDPETWETNTTFLEMKTSAASLKVMSGIAERAVFLIQMFNASLTKDEEQKQYLLMVDLRCRFPVLTL